MCCASGWPTFARRNSPGSGARGGLEERSSLRENLLVASVADLVRMKLTSFRDKDRVHIRDLDGVGLITTEIEAALPDVLRERLARIRATE